MQGPGIQFIREGANRRSLWENLRYQVYLGNERFVEKLQRRLPAGEHLAEVPRLQRRKAKSLGYYARHYPVKEAMRRAYATGEYTLFMTMITSYALFAPDCDTYYYDQAQESSFCSICDNYLKDKPYYPTRISLKRLKYDFCFTYDGQLLISEKAKNFFEDLELDKVSFKKINNDPAVFVLNVNAVIHFDINKRKTRFENKCSLCGQYESIVGSTPPFISDANLIGENDLYITDIKFGSGREKSPLYIVGELLGKELKKKFKELDLEVVRS